MPITRIDSLGPLRTGSYDSFFKSEQVKRDQRVFTKPPRPDLAETGLCWGKPSDFPYTPSSGWGGTGFTVQSPPNPNNPNNAPGEITWNEVKRKTEDKRVENPDDEDQYVIVARIKEITFSTPQGNVKMVLKPPTD